MIYVHLGKPKTGTTTIQKHLVNNVDVLKDQGYLYPQSGMKFWGHHNLYYHLAKSPHCEPQLEHTALLAEELSTYKMGNPQGDVIISSEAFSGANPGLLSRLRDLLKPYDEVRFILYLRSQPSYLRSFWSFHVRLKRTQYAFNKWARRSIDSNQFGVDYLENVKTLWEAIEKDELQIVIYDEIAKVDFCDTFLEICGFDNHSSLKPLPTLEHNTSRLTSIPMDEEIVALCKERYIASNSIIAQQYLDRDYLFESMRS